VLHSRTYSKFLCFSLILGACGSAREGRENSEVVGEGGSQGSEGGGAGRETSEGGNGGSSSTTGGTGGDTSGQTGGASVNTGGTPASGGMTTGGTNGGSMGGTGGTALPAGSVPMFVAIGRGGRRIMSCDKGRTWVANKFVSMQDGEHSTFTPKGLAYGDGTFVFLSGWGNPSTTWVTQNGVDWAEQKHDTGFAGLGYDDGQFVLVGGNYHKGSKDRGATWTRLTPAKANLGRESAAFTGIWAAGSDGRAQILRKGMTNWVDLSGCTGPRHGGIGANGGFAANGETMISVGYEGNVCGVNILTGTAIPASNLGTKISGKPNYNAGSFMVATGNSIRFSTDGSTWTTKTLPQTVRIDHIDCDTTGTCVGISLDGDSFYYSDDATTWKKATAPQGNGMVAVKAGAGSPSDLCKAP